MNNNKTYFDVKDLEQYVSIKTSLSKNSIRHCLSRCGILLKWLKSNNKLLSKETTEEFIYGLKQQGRNNNTLNTYIFSFRQLKNYLINRGIYNGFFEGFESFEKVRPQIIILSHEEVEKIIYQNTMKHSIGPQLLKLQYCYQTLRMFLAYTGVSFDEADKLKVKYIDFENKKILMKREKNGSIRHLYITEPLISRLKKLVENKDNEDLVFTNTRGKRVIITDFTKDLHLAAKRAGIKKHIHCHLFRHTYATFLYSATRDIGIVKEVLGHKDIKSTLVYVHIADEIIKEGMRRHPFVRFNIPAKDYIEIIENAIKTYKLEDDKRFDYLKIKEAIHRFTVNLYQSILPPLIKTVKYPAVH